MTTKTLSQKASNFSLPIFLLSIGVGCLVGMLLLTVSHPLIAFAAMIGVIALILTVIEIEWGLIALVFITYTNLSYVAIYIHGVPSIAKFFVVFLLLAVFIRWAVYDDHPSGWESPTLILGTYGLVGLISLSFAMDISLVKERSMIFFKNAIIVIIVAILLKRARILHRVTWTLLLAGLFMGTISVYQYLTGQFENNFWGYGLAEIRNIVGDTRSFRLTGPIGDSNFYAQIMVMLVPLALNRIFDEKKLFLRILAAWALGVICLTVVFTFSRGAFLALVAVILLMLSRRPLRLQHLTVLLIIGGVLLFFTPKAYIERLETLVGLISGTQSALHEDDAFKGRAAEMFAAFLVFVDNPFLGVGSGNFRMHYPEYARQLGIAVTYEDRSAHSLYLEIAAERGIIGLGLFFGLLWFVFKGLRNAKNDFLKADMPHFAELTVTYAISMVGFLISAIFLHLAYPRYFWLMIGISFAIPHVARRELKIKAKT